MYEWRRIDDALATVTEKTEPFANGAKGGGTTYLPNGVHRLSDTLLLSQLRGHTFIGESPESCIIEVDNITAIRIMRGLRIGFENITFRCGADGMGLFQNSVAFHIVQWSTDATKLTSNTRLRFDRCSFRGFANAFDFEGDQMGDNVTFLDCFWADNLNDFKFRNGQACNVRIYGGEIHGFVGLTNRTDYNSKLTWTGGGVDDGSIFDVTAGGGVYLSNVSIIAKKPWIRFRHLTGVSATDVATVGTNVNMLSWVFSGCTGEIRDTNAPLIKFATPHPTNVAQSNSFRAWVSFEDLRLTVQADPVELIGLVNGLRCFMNRCNLFRSLGPAAVINVKSYLTETTTMQNRALFKATHSSPLQQPAAGTSGNVTGVLHSVTISDEVPVFVT